MRSSSDVIDRLKRAMVKGDGRSLNGLIRSGLSPDYADVQGRSLLYYSVLKKKPNLSRILLKSGANPNGSTSASPLIEAISCGSVELVDLLLSAGADPNVSRHDGSTGLHVAADNCFPDIVEMLIDAGANPSAQDVEGMTPLHASCRTGCLRSIYSLIRAGSPVDCKDRNGLAAFDCLDDEIRPRVDFLVSLSGKPLELKCLSTVEDVYRHKACSSDLSGYKTIYAVFSRSGELYYVGSTSRGRRRLVQHIDQASAALAAHKKPHGHGYWLLRNEPFWSEMSVYFFVVIDAFVNFREIEHRIISHLKPVINRMGENWVYDYVGD